VLISYSANLEDVILNRVFKDIESGFYVDVGSYKPIDASNTMALYAKGWKGVACDPIYNFEKLWANEWHALRPRDIIVRDLIGDRESGEAEFFMCNYRGLSTGAKNIVEKHRDISGASVADNGAKVGTTTLTRVLDHCLNGHTLHLVCIDVEGMEEQVLRGLNFAKYKPWVFVIEAIYSADGMPAYGKWEPILHQHGYEAVYDDRVNRFYLHRDHAELKEHFAYPPNVLDDYKTLREWELERRLTEFESNRPWMGR
jgi:FkbM family methyltransferase